ncbi:MAG TPA: ribosomal protein S18-alanine N-acetyltransferase [Micromonosporaceae bacterium]|nr:ribosomal protein S18-alanine N-acetyltransferase [Micromonosporaceae bacterium]
MTAERSAPSTRAVTITRMRWWHIDEIMPIEADLFGAERWSAPMFWSELANGHEYVVALDEQGHVAGYAGLAYATDEAWVQNVAVRRERQRAGIGRTLMDALLAKSRERGMRSMWLEVAVDNAPAQRLYDAYGFVGVGVRQGYYQPSNTDALVMRRDEATGPNEAMGRDE